MSVDASAVSEGDELPPLDLTPDVEHVRRYFSGSRNSPPFFFDEDAARAQGLPGRLVPGPLKVGFLYGAVEGWLGEGGYVRAVRAAHRRPDVQGNPITVTGSVAHVKLP